MYTCIYTCVHVCICIYVVYMLEKVRLQRSPRNGKHNFGNGALPKRPSGKGRYLVNNSYTDSYDTNSYTYYYYYYYCYYYY